MVDVRRSFRTSDFASSKGLFNECSEHRHSANGSSQTRPCISAKGTWSKHLHALVWAENAEIARTVDLSLKNCMIAWEGGDGEGFLMHRAMPTRLAWVLYLRWAAQAICVQTARK